MTPESVFAQSGNVPLLIAEAHPHARDNVSAVADGEVHNSLGIHDIGRAVMLVAGIGNRRPYLAQNDVCFFGIAVFVDPVLRIADLYQMAKVSRMRIGFKVFVSSQAKPPPQNIFAGSRYGYRRFSKATRMVTYTCLSGLSRFS